jgi:Lon protease-like protein
MIAEEEFHRVIMLERKRIERTSTRKPFLLMLVDMGGCIPPDKEGKVPETVVSALSGFTSDTDVTGWYKDNSVLGVMCREFEPDDRNTILRTMMARVSESFRKNLSDQQLRQMSISFHLFPEEWNHDIPQTPTGPGTSSIIRRKQPMLTAFTVALTSAAGAAMFIRGPVAASAEEEVEVKKLPMMPIRDVVIFPYMMTPFVVGRESSVHALEEALAADKKIFLATQHDASIDEPKPNEIYQVGTVVNIVQSLKLPDGNIKVLVEGIERGEILQVTETEGFMQASVRVARYATQSTPEIETAKQQVKSLFEQYVKLGEWETMTSAVRMGEDPAKLTDTIAANLQLSVEEKQGLLEIFDPAERLNRIGVLLDLEIKKL